MKPVRLPGPLSWLWDQNPVSVNQAGTRPWQTTCRSPALPKRDANTPLEKKRTKKTNKRRKKQEFGHSGSSRRNFSQHHPTSKKVVIRLIYVAEISLPWRKRSMRAPYCLRWVGLDWRNPFLSTGTWSTKVGACS